MLVDVLTRLSSDTGISLDQKRPRLLGLSTEAAKELYRVLQCNKILREVTLAVFKDTVMTLPSYIGELVGMRQHTNELPFALQSIGQPRYITNTIGYKYNNWRDINESAIHTTMSATGVLTLQTAQVETIPAMITIVGKTNTGRRIQEHIVMDSVQKNTINLFGPDINTIGCSTRDRIYDITVLDPTGIELAILHNDQARTRYKVVDVSRVFWALDTSAGETLIDVLYKVPSVNLINDYDSFYTGDDDYDNAWYSMAMYFYLKPIANRQEEAQGYRAAAMDFVQSAKDSGEAGIMKKMSFGRNKFFSLYRRYRYGYPGAITNVDTNLPTP